MEKKFRDYLRHLDKLDFDVISEEEIWESVGTLQFDSFFQEKMSQTVTSPLTQTVTSPLTHKVYLLSSCSRAALMKPEKSGCGLFGRLLSSG